MSTPRGEFGGVTLTDMWVDHVVRGDEPIDKQLATLQSNITPNATAVFQDGKAGMSKQAASAKQKARPKKRGK